MSRIILIETSTSLCSTALIEGDEIIYKESTEPRTQAALTAPFIKEMLDSRGLKASDLDAVCVSKGPGSYTGLRVGVSSAKGLCFGAGLPLIAISTLDTLVWQALEEGLIPEGCSTVVPMIDARRMEVYSAVYRVCDGKVTRLGEIAPVIIDKDSYAAELEAGKVLFIGDGAMKCSGVIACDNPVNAGNATFKEAFPKASSMAKPALAAFGAGNFEDVAYFEPFYLKQFVATVSRKNLF